MPSISFLYPISGNGAQLKDILISTCQGRLTPTSGYPCETGDITAVSTIYWSPDHGRQVALYDGLDWITIQGSEVNVAVPATKFRLFDVFGYNSSGSIALEIINWNQTTGSITNASNASPIVITSNGHGLANSDRVGITGLAGNTSANSTVWQVSSVTTNTFVLVGSAGNGAYTSGGTFYKIPNTRATLLVLQDGVYVKSGDPTRRYLGTCMTTEVSGQTEHSRKRRFIWNYYNRTSSILRSEDTDSLWTYDGAWRVANGKASNRVETITGLQESLLDLRLITSAGVNSSSAWSSIGEDSMVPDASVMGGYYGGNNLGVEIDQQGTCLLAKYPTPGYHFYTWLEQCEGATNFYGSTSDYHSGLLGTIQG